MHSNNRLGVRGVWCGPEDAGRTPSDVAAFLEQLHHAHINLVVMCVKGAGTIHWPSRLYPDAVADGYADFDMPAVLLAECRKRGMQVHAWFIDFMEGPDSQVVAEHPEWLMRNAEGATTRSETLRGSPYHWEWMCPARRPGYTDQYLIPLMAEFAERYTFDAIHHDYIRYPGDLAPDQYCFCDDCLAEIPRYAGYLTEAFPNEPFHHESYDRPYIESHWEQSPRVLPANWVRLSRAMKSRFLLEGSFFQGGRADLDYFFYRYRTDAITRFAREATDAIRSARPGMAVSAAVFKNPVHSGRFIGQDWREFPPHVNIAMPMDYRDHYPGDFETYLTLLAESIGQQKDWACDYDALWPGFAVNFLYYEEDRPLSAVRKMLDNAADAGQVAEALAAVSPRFRELAPALQDRIQAWARGGAPAGAVGLAAAVAEFLAKPPEGYRPESKLTRTVEAIRESGAPGICVFSAGLLTHYGMWDTLRNAFSPDV
ncbi:MAG TPA: family 10 glycosylhydrolase [Armatimonadota bacterium]|jgi:hypothetical protein